jgi:hypothetical protein
MHELSSYVPSTEAATEVVFREELAPVVERINKVIPRDMLWDIFSSTPSETGGVIQFPYSRVDSAVIAARDTAYLLRTYGGSFSEGEYREAYERGCLQAFEALVWVEIGFQGLNNLAKSPASKNWTSAVGHTVTDREREKGIMTTGKQMYMECLSDFINFRTEIGMQDDYFTEYGLEYLLDSIDTV